MGNDEMAAFSVHNPVPRRGQDTKMSYSRKKPFGREVCEPATAVCEQWQPRAGLPVSCHDLSKRYPCSVLHSHCRLFGSEIQEKKKLSEDLLHLQA